MNGLVYLVRVHRIIPIGQMISDCFKVFVSLSSSASGSVRGNLTFIVEDQFHRFATDVRYNQTKLRTDKKTESRLRDALRILSCNIKKIIFLFYLLYNWAGVKSRSSRSATLSDVPDLFR